MNKNKLDITDLKDMLKKSGEKYSEKIAYKIKEKEGKYKEITHKQVRETIDSLGTALIDMGLKNKRIAVIGKNSYEWEISYLSIVCGTGIVVPLDKSLPENELKSLIERSEVEAIFYNEKYEKVLKEIKKEQIGKLKYLISMDKEENEEEIYSQKQLIETGKKLIEEGNKSFIDAKIDNEEMSIMLFTSGTTAKSKIVALSHKNLSSNLMAIASILDVDCNDVFLSFLPLHHVFECTVGFLYALYIGAETCFCEGVKHIIEDLKEYKASVMASVPAIYERIYKIISNQLQKQNKSQEEFKNMLGGNLKLLISGAASLSPEVERKYRNLGLNLVQGYGLTETSPVIAIGTNDYYKEGSVGKAVPGVEAKLVNCDNTGMGELVVKGPSIMLEYFGNEEETKKVLKDGWFYTGDLAKIDEEGYIFISGRKKNVIVLKNGKNIFPEEMENLINQISGVEESFVFGKPVSQDKNDIKIFAKIVYNPELVEDIYHVKETPKVYEIINKEIKKINTEMPKYKAIRGMIVSNEPLIKTTTNKIKRQDNLEQIIKDGF
ncbi:MAG: AMP-binding protein [Clostridia bacterium]|nr:AMP-binding protein [Clostridia bacterium]